MKPDFSGKWTLNRQACTLSPGADAIQRAVAEIKHEDPRFNYKAEFFSGSDSRPVAYEMLSDGKEVRHADDVLTIVSCLRWDGDALIASWAIVNTGGETKIEFRHELTDGGRRLRATETLRGPNHTQDNIWIFDRV